MWLRGKLSAVFALAIALPIALAFGAVWFAGREAARSQALGDLATAARGLAQGIEGTLADRLTLLKTAAGLSALQEVIVADEGREIARMFGEIKAQNPAFVLIVATDAKGQVVASTSARDVNGSLAREEGYRIAASGGIYQSAIAFRETPALTTISFGVPVIAAYDKQTVIGTIVGTLDVGMIAKELKARSTPGEAAAAFALFASRDGRAGFASHSDAVQFAAVKTESEIDWRGTSYLVAGAASRGKGLVRDPGFVVKAGVPAASAFGAFDTILWLIAGAGFAGAAGAAAFLWHWSTPLVQLGTAMVGLARGASGVRAPDAPAESTFGPMARAFESVRQLKAVHEWLSGRERDLTRAKEAAEHALHEKSEHLASLARALKGELSTIVALSEAINAQALKDAAAGVMPSAHAKDIARSGTQLLAVINDLFDLSEAEAGHLTLNEGDVDLAQLVRESTAVMSDAAEMAKVSLGCDGVQAPCPLRADAQKLKQIMFNLLSNAIKFTPEQGRVRVALTFDTDGRPTITVEDTGIGMPSNLSPHAAAPFGAPAETTHGRHGAGLGLPLVRRLVDLHDGRFEIESEPGRGTTAIVRLPARRLVTPEAARLSA